MLNWIRRGFDWATGKIDPTIAGWVHDLINGLWSLLAIIFKDVGGAWDDFVRDANDFRLRIDYWGREIADAFKDVYDWIDKEGHLVYYYITHPVKLVDLLWDDIVAKLESEAWTVGDKLGKFFLSLIVHNIRRFSLLVEDIIHAVL